MADISFDDLPSGGGVSFDDLPQSKGVSFDDLPSSEDRFFNQSSDTKNSELSQFIQGANPNALAPSVVAEPIALDNPTINNAADFTNAYTGSLVKDLIPRIGDGLAGPLLMGGSPQARSAASAVNRASENVEDLISPLNISMAGLIPGAPSLVQKAIGVGFLTQFSKHVPETLSAIAEAKTPEEKGAAYTDAAFNALMLLGAAHGTFGRPSGVPELRKGATQEEIDNAIRLAPEPAKNSQIPDEMLDGMVAAKDAAAKGVADNPNSANLRKLNAELARQLSDVPPERMAQARIRLEEQQIQRQPVEPAAGAETAVPSGSPRSEAATPPEAPQGYKPRIAEAAKTATPAEMAQNAGVEYQGEADGLHAFKDPETGGNFSLKTEDLNPQNVASKVADLRKSFSEQPNIGIGEASEADIEAAIREATAKHAAAGEPTPLTAGVAEVTTPKAVETATKAATPEGYTGGPGAMGPTEAGEMAANQGETSIKNAVVDQSRAEQDIPAREIPLRRSFGSVWDEAKATIDADEKMGVNRGQQLVDELKKKTRPLTDLEDAILTHEQLDRQQVYDEAVRRVNEATDPAEKAQAQAALKEARDAMYEVYDVGQKAGTENARGLNARRMLVRDDYSLAKLEARARAANNGNPLSDKQLEDLRVAHEKIADLEKKLSEAESRGRDDLAKQYFDRLLKETQRDVKESIKQGKSVSDFISDQAAKARARIAERRKSAFSDPLGVMTAIDLADHAIIGADYLAKGVTKLADWSAEMVRDFGEKVKPYLSDIFEKSKQYQEAHEKLFAKAAPKGEQTPEQITTAIDATKPLDHQTVYDLARAHVRAGMEGFENVMGAVRNDLLKKFPNISQREVNDAFYEYGKVKFPSKEADKVKLAEYRRLGQLASAIEDAQNKIVPKKTGLQREKPTQAIREKTAELKAAMDKSGLETQSAEQQLASRNQARATALRNQIEDLDKQLRTGEKPTKGSTPVADSKEVETLRSLRDSMKEELNRIEQEANPPKSPEEKKLDAKIKATEKSIADLDRRLKEGDITPKERSEGITNDKLDALKNERDAMRAQLQEMKGKSRPQPTQEEVAAEAAQRGVDAASAALDRWDKILKGELKPEGKSPSEPKSNLEEDMRAQVEAMKSAYREIQKQEKPASNIEAKRQEQQLKSLKKSIEEYERRVKEADFSPRPQRQGPNTEAVAKAKAARDAAKEAYDQLEKAQTPQKSPEEIRLQSYKTRILNATKELQERLANNDYEKTPKNPLTLDPEASKLKTEYERVRQEVDSKIAEIADKNRTPSQKFWDAFVGIQRAMKLSSDVVLAKLSLAAAAREGVLTPAEEGAAGVISKVLPKLAERAPREGAPSLKAEIEAKRKLFTEGMKDAWDNLRMRKSELEVKYGKRGAEPPPAWYEYLGFLHGALKAPVKRAEFARSLQKRMEFAVKEGRDINDPNVMTELSQEAYVDANRAIFMQDNVVSKGWNVMLSYLDKNKTAPNLGPALARVARFFVPIVKVGTNIVGETATGVHGLLTGGIRAASAYAKGIENLNPSEADLIMRYLKKGLVGNALLLSGYYGYQSIGGLHTPGTNAKPGDVEPGRYRIGGVDLPPAFGHSTAAMLLNIGATVRRVEEDRKKKGYSAPGALAAGAGSATAGLTKEVPFVPAVSGLTDVLQSDRGFENYIHQLITSTTTPAITQHIAKLKDTPGSFPSNLLTPARKRVPESGMKGVKQSVLMGIPGLRESVPEKKSHR